MELDITNLEIEMNRGFLQILSLAALEQRMYGYKMLKVLEKLGYSGRREHSLSYSSQA